MCKRKKKQTIHSQQKIATAQNKNLFFSKIKSICIQLGKPHAFQLIPRSKLDLMFATRFTAFKFEPAAGSCIPKHVINTFHFILQYNLKEYSIVIAANEIGIPLDLFFTAGFVFMHHIKNLKDNEFPKSSQLKQEFNDLLDPEECYKKACFELFDFINAFGLEFNNLGGHMYWVNYELKNPKEGKSQLRNILKVNSMTPERIHVSFKGNYRPAFRVSWPSAQVEPDLVSISPEKLCVPVGNTKDDLKVYIQSHALVRISERLDCLHPGIAHYFVYLSLKDLVSINHHGKLMFEYKIFGIKAGYLVADIKNNKVVIRTFLFLTNNGTPEAENLKELTGLTLADKKFLAIDKLSTFMNAGFAENIHLLNLFDQAGCKSLLELYNRIQHLIEQDKARSGSDAFIARYLQLEKEKEPELIFDEIQEEY